MRDKVARLRQLMSEAVPQQTRPVVAIPANFAGFTEVTPIDQSPRARKMRRILRMAETNQWPQIIEDALDEAQVTCLAQMSDEDLETLLQRLNEFEDCMILCGDSNFSPLR